MYLILVIRSNVNQRSTSYAVKITYVIMWHRSPFLLIILNLCCYSEKGQICSEGQLIRSRSNHIHMFF